MKLRLVLMALVVFACTAVTLQAVEPVDAKLSPTARRVLDYLHSIYGQRVLTGIAHTKEEVKVHEITGKHPAIVAIDISGWNSPTWGDSYRGVVQRYIEDAERYWRDGAIISMQFHWKNPMRADGNAWVDPPRGTGPVDMAKAVTPGTPEHEAVMRDLKLTADYLEKLRDADVPVLWRPLHEIDGGWFWWTDRNTPENTAALWRMMFDYYVNERGLHNLIWVYSAGLKPPKGKDVAQIDVRRRFYPGDQYVDIAGIDIYPNNYYGWKTAQQDTYAKAYEIMQQVAPGKMLALCETAAIVDPAMMADAGPKWLYVLPWWASNKDNPVEWTKTSYTHPLMLNRDELPRFIETKP